MARVQANSQVSAARMPRADRSVHSALWAARLFLLLPLLSACTGAPKPPNLAPIRPLKEIERAQLLDGVEWISLELSLRFLTDALEEAYFGWNPLRFPGRGEHNLARSRGQYALHLSARRTRPQRARLLQTSSA